jgi:hypothetical protein
MKLKILILVVLISNTLVAQEPQTTPPVIVAKIALGETVLFESTAISFKGVIEDSRCPKNVDCIWAGQAKVLVAIKSNGTTTEKDLVFHGTNFGQESENTLFVSDTKKYIVYRLSPYPVSTVSPDKRNYFLEVYLK